MEDKIDFSSKLKDISPKRILSADKNDYEDFFLVLAMIFNDLKSLIFYDVNLEEKYRMPEEGEVTAHAGEFSGIRLHHYKILAGLVREFLAFLKENESVLKSAEFKLLLLRVPADVRRKWSELVELALGRDVTTKSTFAYSLLLIRNDIGFHYTQAQKNLRQGFEESFYGEATTYNDRAYYALGDSMRDTRFYYADAAMQGYISQKAKKVHLSKDVTQLTVRQHQKKLHDTAHDINKVIQVLMAQYLEMQKVKKL